MENKIINTTTGEVVAPNTKWQISTIAYEYLTALNQSPSKLKLDATLMIQDNPRLAECSKTSLMLALGKAISLGLSTEKTEGHFTIIPYDGLAQIQFQYKGLLYILLKNNENVKECLWSPIYENDTNKTLAQIIDGYKQREQMTPNEISLQSKQKVVGYISWITMNDGERFSEYLTMQEILEHKQKYARSDKPNSPWNTSPEIMALKTTLKKLFRNVVKNYPNKFKGLNEIAKIDQGAFNENAQIEYVDNPQNDKLPQSTVVSGEMQMETMIYKLPKEISQRFYQDFKILVGINDSLSFNEKNAIITNISEKWNEYAMQNNLELILKKNTLSKENKTKEVEYSYASLKGKSIAPFLEFIKGLQ